MHMFKASRPSLASLITASCSVFSSARSSSAFFVLFLRSPMSFSKDFKSPESLSRRDSSFPMAAFTASISSAAVSRFCFASDCALSHQPFWLASFSDCFNNRSMRSWISTLTFAMGSLSPATCVAREVSSVLRSSAPLLLSRSAISWRPSSPGWRFTADKNADFRGFWADFATRTCTNDTSSAASASASMAAMASPFLATSFARRTLAAC
mmetsp:Transcript_123425/g.345565  ORF Transcript_123425/g.345565 Transcript_123425/m.345565 type:complete len:210 (+) Transcript_123425:613-1242(+)